MTAEIDPADVVGSVEEAASRLYAGPVETFVADRNALAKRIRDGGDRELAAAVKALRKPTVVADALNKTVQADPDGVEALVTAAAELRRAQEAMLAGERGDFAERQADYRQAVDRLVAGAGEQVDAVRAAVEVAAVGGLDDELRAGIFAQPPQPTGGFGPFELGLPPTPGSQATGAQLGRKRRRTAATGAGGDDAPPVVDELERKRAQRAARKAAEEAVARAAADLKAAEQARSDAEGLVESLDDEIAELERHLASVRTSRADAAAVLTAAEEEVADAEALVAAAKDALRQLGRRPTRDG